MRVSDVLAAGDEIRVEGADVGMVVLVGVIRQVKAEATKTVYALEDANATVECIHWTDEQKQRPEGGDVSEGEIARVIGSVRTNGDKKTVMVFRISAVDDAKDAEAHKLEVEHAKLMIRRARDKENAATFGNGGGELANSMMGGGAVAATSSSTSSYGNAKQDAVYQLVRGCEREEGIGKDEIVNALVGKISSSEVNSALDFLSGEGHIYSTIDDDHYKAIEG